MSKTGQIVDGVFHETEGGILVPTTKPRPTKATTEQRLAELEALVAEKKPPPPPAKIPATSLRKMAGISKCKQASQATPKPVVITCLDDALNLGAANWKKNPRLRAEWSRNTNPERAYAAWIRAEWERASR